MDEQAWLTATDAKTMLAFLRTSGMSDRKFRLFALACCRRTWHLLIDRRSRKAIEAGEQYADGLIDTKTRDRARQRANEAFVDAAGQYSGIAPEFSAAYAVRAALTADRTIRQACITVSDMTVRAAELDNHQGNYDFQASAEARRFHVALLRDVFGLLPFRPLSPLSPSLLAWNEGLVVKLAQAAYEHRLLPAGTLDLERLGVLADALEEGGCTDEGLLAHLRTAGPHTRGCFAVDAILGKQ